MAYILGLFLFDERPLMNLHVSLLVGRGYTQLTLYIRTVVHKKSTARFYDCAGCQMCQQPEAECLNWRT